MTTGLTRNLNSGRFYDQAWGFRGQLIGRMIEEGDRCPLRLFKRLAGIERRSEIRLNLETDTISLQPRTFVNEELGPAGLPLFHPTSLRGQRLTVPFYNVGSLYHLYLIDYIERTGPYDVIIELGCGLGRNLFEIFYGGGPLGIPYWGGDISEVGLAVARRVAGLDPEFPGHFFAFDHLRPCLDAVPRFERALVFTCHSLEQVPEVDSRFFSTVADAAKRVTCLHFEPFGFQIQMLGEVSRKQAADNAVRGWNTNLAWAMQAAKAAGIIKLVYVATEIFLPSDWGNPTSLAVWTAGD